MDEKSGEAPVARYHHHTKSLQNPLTGHVRVVDDELDYIEFVAPRGSVSNVSDRGAAISADAGKGR